MNEDKMTVGEFITMALGNTDKIIFDYAKGEKVFKGNSQEAIKAYGDYELLGWDYAENKLDIVIYLDTSSDNK